MKKAMETFSVEEKEKITALGSDSYVLGKSVNTIKQDLDGDYLLLKQKELVEKAKKARLENVQNGAKRQLNAQNIQSDFVGSPNEYKVEISEVRLQNQFLKKLKNEEDKSAPLGSAVLKKGGFSCRSQDVLLRLIELRNSEDEEFQEAFKKELNRRLRRKECYRITQNRVRKLLATSSSEAAPQIYKTTLGWAPAEYFDNLPSEEDVKRLREEHKQQIEKMKKDPPSQFYVALRPLLDISPANISRIQLAEKAIALNVANNKENWEQAAKRFVQEQKAFKETQYPCYATKECEASDKYNLRMAYYILAPEPKIEKKGELPCEVLSILDCKKVLEPETDLTERSEAIRNKVH